MTLSSLLALSPLDGRYADKVHALRPIFSEYGLIKYRVLVEIRWLEQLATLNEFFVLDQETLAFLESIIEQFSDNDALRIKQIESEINHDVKAIEYFIKEKASAHAELAKKMEFIHFGCTSEDINNLAYGCMLKAARDQCLLPALNTILHQLKSLAHEYADQAMLALTHGQPASPSTIGKEMANFCARLERQMNQLISAPILGKLNGATGNFSALQTTYPTVDWPAVTKAFIHELGLVANPYTTQIEPHDYLAEWCNVLMRIHSILIDLNRDCWGYISLEYFQLKSLPQEVGSSTMPHKVNPIDFENAEGNLGLANALLDHMAQKLPVSRFQRDLSDSTVLRNMGVAFGYGLLAYLSTTKGLSKISPNVAQLKQVLDQHWEILAEPIQMMMRKHGISEPYEKLKAFTRGKKMDKKLLHQFIQELNLPDAVKQQLYSLTPENYIGLAAHLAKKI